MPDGPAQIERDKALSEIDWITPNVWQWGDPEYQTRLMAVDVINNASEAFDSWLHNVSSL
jgi:hypothetical protein